MEKSPWDKLAKFFDDLFDWDLEGVRDFLFESPPSPPQRHRDSSVMSTFIAEYVKPTVDELPPPYGKQEHRDIASIISTCEGFLKANAVRGSKWGIEYQFCRPSLIKYPPKQWLWDDCAHIITWTHIDIKCAIRSFRTLMAMQQPDGRIPEITNWGEETNVEWILHHSLYSSEKCVDLTQMPLPPYALDALYRKTMDKALLTEFVGKVISYYEVSKFVGFRV
eukprot:TRINITY_DN3778_c0_g2_i1.p1 TRINITY_DN3778_c0_g2~~TRINITY_DN3778_c0_g2_i1.p1  ORF type:complete len:255 (-),score=55.95 TRINITY_DN3778_c0_g2_i1:1179-1844(-)